jgi:hypothetical protein
MSDRDQSEGARPGPDATSGAESPVKRPWVAPVVSRAELITSTKKCFSVAESPVFDYGPS